MASPTVWGGGLNLTGTVFDGGPTMLELAPAYLSGSVQWLDTISGSNANAGTSPELPVLTLAQAVTNSAANGVIVIGAGSAETLALSQSLSLAGLTIVGCGSGSSRPRYTCNGAVVMWSIAAAGVRIRNIYFPASTVAGGNRIGGASANYEVKDCYFECGTLDTAAAMTVSAASGRIRGNSYVVTASRPAIGLAITSAIADTLIEDCIFDGGSFGWTDFALKISAAATRVQIENVSLLRRSDMTITTTASSYQLFGLTNDGTNNVVLAA